jgi:signal peptidase I
VKRALEYLAIVAVAILVALAVQSWLLKPYRIPSGSMLDTLRPGDRVLVNRVVYHLRDPHRGDVIVFHYPEDPDVVFIKRVVGVPGDTLEVRDGRLYVNGRKLAEPYVHQSSGHVDPTVAQAAIAGSTMHDPWSLALCRGPPSSAKGWPRTGRSRAFGRSDTLPPGGSGER